MKKQRKLLLLLIMVLMMFMISCEKSSDDDDDNDDNDDDDSPPPAVTYSGWLIPETEREVIYRISDGVWEDIFVPPGFPYYAAGVATFGSLVYVWSSEGACTVWRLAYGWKELYLIDTEDGHMPDIAFFAEDAYIGYMYDHYNEPHVDSLFKYDPATDRHEWIFPEIEVRGVFSGFDGAAYVFDAEKIYRFDGADLIEVAAHPSGDIRAAGPLGEGFFAETGDSIEFFDDAAWSTLFDRFYGQVMTDADGDILVADYQEYNEYEYLRIVDGQAIPNRWFDLVGFAPSALLPGDAALFISRETPEALACPESPGAVYRIVVDGDEASCDVIDTIGMLHIDGSFRTRVRNLP